MRRSSGRDRSRSEPRTSGPISVADVLQQVIREKGYGDAVGLELCRKAWSEILPAELARLSRPLKLEGGVLVVAVTDTVVHQELSMQAARLLSRLQDAVTMGTRPRRLRFVVLPGPR